MNTAALRELIQQAHVSEARHGYLADLIASRLPHLHRTIQPQGENTEDILTRFVHAYVEQVPDLLDAANSVAREAGIEERIKPVLKVAEQFSSPRRRCSPATTASTPCSTRPTWRTAWWRR